MCYRWTDNHLATLGTDSLPKTTYVKQFLAIYNYGYVCSQMIGLFCAFVGKKKRSIYDVRVSSFYLFLSLVN